MINAGDRWNLRFNKLTEGLEEIQTNYVVFDENYFVRFRILWLLVIRQALFDYVKWKHSKILKNRRDAEDAKKWLFESSGHSNSLELVCELIGIHPDTVRRTAERMTPKDVRKMEIQERENNNSKEFVNLLLVKGKKPEELDECDGDYQ